MRHLVCLVLIPGFLSGCGASNALGSLNPFGGSGGAPVTQGTAEAAQVPVADGSVLLPSVSEVVPEPALRGIILRARAVAPTQGYHDARLVPVANGAPDADGIVTYQLRAAPPVFAQIAGPEQTRTLLAAAFVRDDDLEGIRGFRIVTQGRTVNLRR